MIYRPYGKTGKDVSLIGFGTLRMPPDGEAFASNVEMVQQAIEMGINYFDTDATYAQGASEKALAAVFREMDTSGIHLALKSIITADPTADDVLRRIDTELSGLHLEKISFFHMWCVLTLEQYQRIIAPGGPYEGALKAKEQGLIDHICFSAHCSGAEIERILSDGLFDGVTLGLNALNYRYRLGGLQAAAERGMGTAIMNPLAGGLIPQNPGYFRQLASGGSVVDGALQFLAAHDAVSTILIGVHSMQDLTQAVRAVSEAPRRTAEQWHQIADTQSIPAEPLCTMCNYCAGCPAGLAVNQLMGGYNAYLLSGGDEQRFHEQRKMLYGSDPFETAACIRCGRCERKCTQHLPIIRRIAQINAMCGRNAERYRKQYEEWFRKGRRLKTGFYGFSIDAEIMLRAFQAFYGELPPDVWFFDSNPGKWGKQVPGTGQVIHPPEDLRILGIQRVVITASKFEKQIRQFLRDYLTEGTEIDVLG